MLGKNVLRSPCEHPRQPGSYGSCKQVIQLLIYPFMGSLKWGSMYVLRTHNMKYTFLTKSKYTKLKCNTFSVNSVVNSIDIFQIFLFRSVPWSFKTKEQILGYGGLFQRPSPVGPVLNR